MKLAAGQMKDETACVVTEEYVGLKPMVYSFFMDDNSEHKKQSVYIKMQLRQ